MLYCSCAVLPSICSTMCPGSVQLTQIKTVKVNSRSICQNKHILICLLGAPSQKHKTKKNLFCHCTCLQKRDSQQHLWGFIIMELIVNNYRNIVVILTFIYIFSIFYFSLQIICTFWLFSSNLSSFIQSLTWTKRTLTVLLSVSVLLLWHLSIN